MGQLDSLPAAPVSIISAAFLGAASYAPLAAWADRIGTDASMWMTTFAAVTSFVFFITKGDIGNLTRVASIATYFLSGAYFANAMYGTDDLASVLYMPFRPVVDAVQTAFS